MKNHKNGPNVHIYANKLSIEYNWTQKNRPQMSTVGYNGLNIESLHLYILDRLKIHECVLP